MFYFHIKNQKHLDLIDKWSTNWKIKINALQKVTIPSSSQVKYLGIILDKKLTWGPYLKTKRKSLNSRSRLLRSLQKFKLPLHNKILIYKTMLRPIWSFGAQTLGCAKPLQLKTIEALHFSSCNHVRSLVCFLSHPTQRFKHRISC